MAYGRSIRIYLADAVPTGIRHAELINWTGQAVVCPKARIGELVHWEEVRRPGVYFLLAGEAANSRTVYIGQAEDVLVRLKYHVRQKPFWDQVVAFTSKDQNLTKVHVAYLEARLVEEAYEVGRATMKNANSPNPPKLPRADQDAMEEYLEHLRLLLGALGFRFLQPLVGERRPAHELEVATRLSDVDFHLAIPKSGVEAHGRMTDEGFVVLRDSVGTSAAKASMRASQLALRNELKEAGALVGEGARLIFKKDVLFSSSSMAATILGGASLNGRQVWKDGSRRTLKSWEDSLLDEAPD